MADRRKILPLSLSRPSLRALLGVLLVLGVLQPPAEASGTGEDAPPLEIRIHSGEAGVPTASIIDPAARLSVELAARQTDGVPRRTVTVRAAIQSLTTGQTVWSKERVVELPGGGNARVVRLEDVRLPQRDDAYRVTGRILETRGLLSFSESATYAETSQHLYAISSRPELRGAPQWEPRQSLLPADRPWWNPQTLADRLPLGNDLPLPTPLELGEHLDVTRQLKLRRDLDAWLGSGETSVGSATCERDTWQGAPAYRLEPNGWHVWPLPECDATKPHRVVVRIPHDRAAHLSVGIVDPAVAPSTGDENESVLPVHGSALAYQPATRRPAAAGGNGDAIEHRLTFWPCGQQYLMIRNLDPHNHVLIRSIAVEADVSLPAAPDEARSADVTDEPVGRLVAFYANAQMLRSLGHQPSRSIGEGASDHAAERRLAIARYLTWHVQRSGFNAAIVELNADDPLARCLLHLFDREGLRLLPALDLQAVAQQNGAEASDAPPSATDTPRRAMDRSSEADRNPDAQPPTGKAPVLDADARRHLLDFIASQLDSLRGHASFGGIALRLTEQSPLTFATLDGGADASVLESFCRDSGKTFATPAAARTWLASEGRAPWLAYRAQRTTQLLQQIGELAGPGQVLVLIDSAGAPSRDPLDQELLLRGIDLAALGASTGISPLLRYRWRPTAPFPARQADYVAALRNRHATAPDAGVGGWIDPTDRFDLLSIRTAPGSSSETKVRAPSAERDPQREQLPIARLLNTSDLPVVIVGGSQFPWGIEGANRTLLSTLAQLPDGCTDIGPSEGGPRLRAVNSRGGRFLYATNDNLWPHVINVEFDETASPAPIPVGFTKHVQQTIQANRWQAELPPGGLTAIRLSPAARVRRLSVRPANLEQTATEIRSQLQDLGQRVAVFSSLAAGQLIPAGSFEEHEGGKPVAWLAAQHPSNAVSIDDRRASDGERSVRLENDVPASTQTWLLSKPLVPTTSGRMMISLNACTDADPQQLPTVRLSIEARYADRPTRTSVVLGDPASGPALSADWSTQRFSVSTTDLPSEGLQELRVAVDVQGAGRVWIDDIRRHDFFLLPATRADLQRQIFLASEGLSVGDLDPASRLFSNPLVVQLRQLAMPEPAAPRSPVERSQPRPTIADRLRGLLPQALQF